MLIVQSRASRKEQHSKKAGRGGRKSGKRLSMEQGVSDQSIEQACMYTQGLTLAEQARALRHGKNGPKMNSVSSICSRRDERRERERERERSPQDGSRADRGSNKEKRRSRSSGVKSSNEGGSRKERASRKEKGCAFFSLLRAISTSSQQHQGAWLTQGTRIAQGERVRVADFLLTFRANCSSKDRGSRKERGCATLSLAL